MREAENGRNKRRRNLGMDMPKKQLVAEALIDLHRRLSALPTRSHERRIVMQETAFPRQGNPSVQVALVGKEPN